MPKPFTTIAIRRKTLPKLRRVFKSRFPGMTIWAAMDAWVERELETLARERTIDFPTPPGRSGTDGVSSPPLPVSQHEAAGDLKDPEPLAPPQ